MEKLRRISYYLLLVLSTFLTACSVLSIRRNEGIRFLKMLDFPRIQILILSVITIIILILVVKRWKWYNYLIIVGLLSAITINGKYLANYTFLVPVAVPSIENVSASNQQISLLLINVQMSNRNSASIIDVIRTKEPDLVLAMEVDQWWDEELKIVANEFPHCQRAINEVAYGMVLYSKFPLKSTKVDYFNNKNVPSFESLITLPKGKSVNFHAMHPVPPTHFKQLPDNAGQKESAMRRLGKRIKTEHLPTIVAGDLNDVVWSYIDELTNTKNILFDVREGRGFYNSFSAKNIFMRWPLDHVFVTKQFHLQKLERLSYIGSDHYPIYVELVL